MRQQTVSSLSVTNKANISISKLHHLSYVNLVQLHSWFLFTISYFCLKIILNFHQQYDWARRTSRQTKFSLNEIRNLEVLNKDCQFSRLVWTKWSIPWSRVLEKVLFSQLLEKLPAFYGTQSFITMFTRACHFSLSVARWIKPSLYLFKTHFNIILLIVPLTAGA
jgi:hypothetical protein